MRFGKFLLLEPLGEGAMGQVWRALDGALEREVALKLLRPGDGAFRTRLVAEAHIAARLNHPNIATIYEAGDVDGAPYISMELVEGETLFRRMEPMGEAELRQVGAQASRALAHAHAKGVVHRDIKPENLVLLPDGRLKILDFGIARLALGPGEARRTWMEETIQGTTHGTPAYMSPEQIEAQEVGPPSDQFSLGVVLYELAARRHPFREPSLVGTLQSIRSQDPTPLDQLRGDLGTEVVEAIHRMLAKRPEDRWPGLEALAQAFEPGSGAPSRGLLATTPLALPPSPRPPRRWLGILGAGLILGGGALATFFAWKQASRSSPLPGGRRMVAVLPLVAVRPDPEKAWLSTSFTDAMTSGLLPRQDVLVLDRSRVAEALKRYGEGGIELEASRPLIEDLKADLLVLGNYLVLGERLRLTIRVMDGRTRLTTHQFQIERPLSDLLGLEEELRSRLPEEMGLGGRAVLIGANALAKDPRTRELYARADELIHQNPDEAGLERAIQFLRVGLAQEPNYAPTYALLGDALALMANRWVYSGRTMEGAKLLEEAKTMGERAVALGPDLAMGHRALAQALLRQGHMPEALREARQAERLNPADPQTQVAIGSIQEFGGLPEGFEPARLAYRRALELDPRDWNIWFRLSVLLGMNGELEEAVRAGEKAKSLNPTSPLPYIATANALQWSGRYREAEACVRAGLQIFPREKRLLNILAYSTFEQHDEAGFRWAIEQPTPQRATQADEALIAGLGAGMRKDGAGLERIYEGYLRRIQGQPWRNWPQGDQRSTTFNLYYMARTVAEQRGPGKAEALLRQAEEMYPNLRKLARRDPAFGPR